MMLYKKDFRAVADIIYRGKGNSWWIATKLADYFATKNKHFDRDKFLQACVSGLK